MSRRNAIGLPLLFAGILGVMRWVFPERTMDSVGLRAIMDSVFAIGFLAITFLLAAGLGAKILQQFSLEEISPTEKLVFGIALGFGTLAYGVMVLGFLNALTVWAILGWLVFIGIVTASEWGDLVARIPQSLKRGWVGFKEAGVPVRVFTGLAIAIFGLSALQALTPPWDYDGLMYHLQAPRLFLEAGRIYLLPDIWQANGPFTIEMLYTVGLAFGSASFARLVHLAFAILLVLGTYLGGRRFISPVGGWIAAAVLVGIPIFPIWGSLAYADMGWAIYEFLALYALLTWWKNRRQSWLLLSAVCLGLALGSKYLALGAGAVFGLTVLAATWRTGARGSIKNGWIYGSVAVAVAAPWYLKNLVLAGNPVYPFFLGGPGWNPDRLGLITTYLNGFGMGKGFLELVQLPWRLYANHIAFATFMSSIEFPSFLFPFALLYPVSRKTGVISTLAWMTLARTLVWAFGSQQTRFLLPLFPAYSLLTGYVVLWLGSFIRKPERRVTLGAGLLGGVVAVTLVYQVIYFASVTPLPVLSGGESVDGFLRRAVYDYPGIRFVQENLPADAQVLMFYDGQGYYCDGRCLPDADQARLVKAFTPAQQIRETSVDLLTAGITHIFLDLEGLNFFLQHDPEKRHADAASRFYDEFVPECGQLVFKDQSVQIYEVQCQERPK